MPDTTRNRLLALAEKFKTADQSSRADLIKQGGDLKAYYQALDALYTDLDLGDVEVSAKYHVYDVGDKVLRAAGIDMNSDEPIFSKVAEIAREITVGQQRGEVLKDLGDESYLQWLGGEEK